MSGPKARTNSSVARDSARMVGATIVAQVFTLARGLVLPGLLSVAGYGTWRFVQLILSWAPYLECGVANGLVRQVSIFRVQNQPRQIDEYHSTAFVFVVTLATAGALLLVGSALFVQDAVLRWALLFASIAVLAVNVENLLIGRLRADNRFRIISGATVLKAAGATILATSGAWLFGPNGAVAGLAIAMSGVALFLLWRGAYPCIPSVRKEPLVTMIHVGLPLSFAAFTYTAVQAIDQAVIVGGVGREQLGLYGIGLVFCALILGPAHAVAQVLATRIYETAGRQGRSEKLVRFTSAFTLVLAASAFLLAGAACVGTDAVVHLIYPKFVAGIAAARLLVWHTGFAAAALPMNFVFAAFQKSVRLATLQAIALVFALILDVLALQLGLGIAGVAAATAATYAALAVMLIPQAVRLAGGTLKNTLFVSLQICALFAYVASVAWAIDSLWPTPPERSLATFQSLIFNEMRYGLGILPVAIFATLKMRSGLRAV